MILDLTTLRTMAENGAQVLARALIISLGCSCTLCLLALPHGLNYGGAMWSATDGPQICKWLASVFVKLPFTGLGARSRQERLSLNHVTFATLASGVHTTPEFWSCTLSLTPFFLKQQHIFLFVYYQPQITDRVPGDLLLCGLLSNHNQTHLFQLIRNFLMQWLDQVRMIMVGRSPGRWVYRNRVGDQGLG